MSTGPGPLRSSALSASPEMDATLLRSLSTNTHLGDTTQVYTFEVQQRCEFQDQGNFSSDSGFASKSELWGPGGWAAQQPLYHPPLTHAESSGQWAIPRCAAVTTRC